MAIGSKNTLPKIVSSDEDTKAARIASVSYTHLDVYKRQDEDLIIVEIDGIDEGIHQCLPLLRLGHIQLTETEQSEPDEFFFHLRLCQLFFCNCLLYTSRCV